MRLLLDTHAFLWLDAHPELLSPKVRIACQDRTNILFLSIVSLWEMQVKIQIGKLSLGKSLSPLSMNSKSRTVLNYFPSLQIISID